MGSLRNVIILLLFAKDVRLYIRRDEQLMVVILGQLRRNCARHAIYGWRGYSV
jgi:hypothetical protein